MAPLGTDAYGAGLEKRTRTQMEHSGWQALPQMQPARWGEGSPAHLVQMQIQLQEVWGGPGGLHS